MKLTGEKRGKAIPGMSVDANTGVTIRFSPEILAEQFFKMDRGDTSHLRDLDVIIDLPEVLTVARMHFAAGTGYEVVFSEAADHDDYAAAVSFIGSAHLIHCEPYGYNASGYPQMRALHWERRQVFAG